MAIIKRIDVDKYFAERRAMRLGRIGLVSRPGGARTEPAGKYRGLIGNRALLKPAPGDSPTSIPMVAGSDVGKDGTLSGSVEE
jgi:hypothetical protein